MSTTVLVVGSTGYIGEGVALAFRRAGYRVVGLTRQKEKAVYLQKNEIIPIVGTHGDPAQFKEEILRAHIIVDAVGLSEHTETFFNYVRELKKKHTETRIANYKPLFIFTGGIMTYATGPRVDFPLDESFNPTPEDQVEMVPKKAFEDKLLVDEVLRPVVVRPGFVYGGHGGPIADLFFDVKADEKELVLWGSPDKRWSWVHVDDLGEAYVKIAQAGSVVDGQIFNVSAPDHPTYEELKLKGAQLAGWKGSKADIKLTPVPDHLDRVKNWEWNVIINPQKAYNLLGWRPTHVGVINELPIYYASWKAAKHSKSQ